MASKRKVALSDYDMTTTLGTGKSLDLNRYRLIWKSATDEEQEDWRVLRHEDFKEGRYYQAETGRPCDIRKHYTCRYRPPLSCKNLYSNNYHY